MIFIRITRILIMTFMLIISMMCGHICAQILHTKNESQRLNIDAKAVITPTNSKEALARSREFIEIDSTYFLGYMYEGIYKVRHAQDLIGYKNATEPLEHAYALLLRDYKKEITKRSTDVFDIYYGFQLQMYLQELAYNLYDAYMNAQEFQKAYDLALDVAHLNIQLEYYFQSYTHIAWIIHKLRIFNSKDYSFLHDDVYSNVRLAMSYLDSAYNKAEEDQKLNVNYFDVYTENIYGIAHYQAILYTYLFQMDSANYYYDILKERGQYSHGNRGNFLYVSGKFRLAEEEYNKARELYTDAMSKELKEHIYYSSFININKCADRPYINALKKTLEIENSKPGFGWYNLAMARVLLYSGQITQSEKFIDKAENFKELHIGTTLGNEHYQLSLFMVKYIHAKQTLKAFKNKNDNWYWNPVNWFRVAKMSFDRYINRYNLISLLAENPEREQVIYSIFASESVVFWDEVVHILNEINPQYFIDFYEKAIQDNELRPSILPYQKLMLAQLYLGEGDYEKADELVEDILLDAQIDVEYETYLVARAMSLKSIILSENNEKSASKNMFYQMYRIYPSLALTEEGELDIYIQNADGVPDELLNSIEKSHLNIVQEIKENTAVLSLKYELINERHHVSVIVAGSDAEIIISEVKLKNDDIEILSDEVYASIFGFFPSTETEEESE